MSVSEPDRQRAGDSEMDVESAAVAMPAALADACTVPAVTRPTSARRARWDALNSQPGATTRELACTTGVSYPHARQTLCEWERAGRAERRFGWQGDGKRWRALDPIVPNPHEPTRPSSAELITYPFVLNSGPVRYLTQPRDITNRDVERLARYLKSQVMSEDDLTDPPRSFESSTGVVAPGEV